MKKFFEEIKGWGHSYWYGLLSVITGTLSKTFWGLFLKILKVIDTKRQEETKFWGHVFNRYLKKEIFMTFLHIKWLMVTQNKISNPQNQWY